MAWPLKKVRKFDREARCPARSNHSLTRSAEKVQGSTGRPAGEAGGWLPSGALVYPFKHLLLIMRGRRAGMSFYAMAIAAVHNAIYTIGEERCKPTIDSKARSQKILLGTLYRTNNLYSVRHAEFIHMLIVSVNASWHLHTIISCFHLSHNPIYIWSQCFLHHPCVFLKIRELSASPANANCRLAIW